MAFKEGVISFRAIPRYYDGTIHSRETSLLVSATTPTPGKSERARKCVYEREIDSH